MWNYLHCVKITSTTVYLLLSGLPVFKWCHLIINNSFDPGINYLLLQLLLSCRQMESGYGGQWMCATPTLREGCSVPAEVYWSCCVDVNGRCSYNYMHVPYYMYCHLLTVYKVASMLQHIIQQHVLIKSIMYLISTLYVFKWHMNTIYSKLSRVKILMFFTYLDKIYYMWCLTLDLCLFYLCFYPNVLLQYKFIGT